MQSWFGNHRPPDHDHNHVDTREELIASLYDPVRTIITQDGWKLNHSPLGQHELYNLKEDPGETGNRAAMEEHAALIQDLRQRIQRWQTRTGDAPLIGACGTD